jgi:hypothetical protein
MLRSPRAENQKKYSPGKNQWSRLLTASSFSLIMILWELTPFPSHWRRDDECENDFTKRGVI